VKTLTEMRQETQVPVIMTDHQGFIIYVNHAFNTVFGWEPNEILGRTLAAVIPRSYHDAHNLGFARFTLTEQSQVLNHPLRLIAVTKEGQEILSEHFITAEQQGEQWIFAAILRPIQEP
jgi:PAS domain S-box-containing protein